MINNSDIMTLIGEKFSPFGLLVFGWQEKNKIIMSFNIIFLLSLIILLIMALIVVIMAYPGPVDGKRRAKSG